MTKQEEQAYELWEHLPDLERYELLDGNIADAFVYGYLLGQPKWKKFKDELPPAGKDFLWKTAKHNIKAVASWSDYFEQWEVPNYGYWSLVGLQEAEIGEDEWQPIN